MRLKWLRLLVPVSAVLAIAFVLSSCGSSSDETTASSGGGTGVPDQFAAVTAAPDNAKQGGDLTLLNEGDIDYMDPGAAYYQVTYTLDLAAQRGLLGWPPDATEPQPDLATEQPKVTDDGKTITFTIRDDVKFSPPVNRVATSADVKYAIERTLLPGVPNGYTANYLADVEGLKEAQAAAAKDETVAPDISGIETPNDTTIVFHLTKSSSQGVIGALSLPFSAPVPEEYAKEFDAQTPSTYGEHVVFTGPYMVENNSSGELTGYTPGKEIKMVRNPNWDPNTDFRPAYLDTITWQEGFTDPTSASKKILTGDSQMSGDFPPSPTVVKDIASGSQYDTSQMVAVPSGGNRYIALNTAEPPFDDVNVRKAVVANSDRVALRNTRGGELFGPVATHFLPPLIPGFEEAGGLEGDPSLDFLQSPTGDPAVAAKYMKKAGYSSGKCEGDCDITMVGDDAPPGQDTATVFKDELEQLGFKVSFQPVEHSIMYTKFCSVPSNQPQVCPNVGWIKDFNDGQAMIDIPFNGGTINPSNNSNWPRLDDPEINKLLAQDKLITDPDQRAQAYGELDTKITALAPAVPWVWDNDILVQSSNVAGVSNLFNGEWDLSYTSLK
jgi:peptide/nickel transport system substrate-binding protein